MAKQIEPDFDFFQQKDRFDFSIDEECIEIYDRGSLLCILTFPQFLQLQKILKEASVEWGKVNKR